MQAIGLRLFGAALLIAIGFAGAKLTTPEPSAGLAPAACPEPAASKPPQEAVRSKRSARPIERPFLVRPMEVFAPADPEAELRYQKSQAEQLMGLVRQKLQHQRLIFPNEDPEVTASSVTQWMTGLTDGLVRTAPDLAEELAAQIEASVCDPATDPAELITTSLMMKVLPELANPNTFECAFRRPGDDAVLWTALDAFQASGLPKPDALLALERSATHEHTRFRMLPALERAKVMRAQSGRGSDHDEAEGSADEEDVEKEAPHE